jgi:hypothetical protein
VFGLEFFLAVAAAVGFVSGAWGIVLDRVYSGRCPNTWGRWLTMGAIVFLGVGSMIAAFHRAEGLVPCGLSAGFLVVGLLWGEPSAPVSSTSLD